VILRIERSTPARLTALMMTVTLAGLFTGAVMAKPVSAGEAYRLSMENDAKLIESVSAHLAGIAQLQRVIVKDLDWKAPANRERRHVQEAIKDFKNSQVLLSEAMTNTGVLLGRLDGERKKRLQAQVDGLRARTGDISAKNAAMIHQLEADQLPSTQDLHELTQSMLAVIGYGIEVSRAKASTTTAPGAGVGAPTVTPTVAPKSAGSKSIAKSSAK
jgi:hypothetical protein